MMIIPVHADCNVVQLNVIQIVNTADYFHQPILRGVNILCQ